MVRLDDVNTLLKNYMGLIGDIKATVIVDNDGLVVASTLKSDEDLVMSALTAHLQTLSERIKQEADSGYFKNLTLEMEKQKFIFNEAGASYLLLTVVDKDASMDKILGYAKNVAEKIDKILHGEPISLEIDKISTVPVPVKESEPEAMKKCIYKVVIVGNPRVGKTSLIVNFAKGRFQSTYKPTLGVDVIKHTYIYENKININFTAWDISGQASFKKLRKMYYPGTDGIFIIYDITNKESFESVGEWVEEIKQYTQKKDSFFILVGNKNDLESERTVSKDMGKAKAEECDIYFYETSAKTGDNVRDMFLFLGEKIVKSKKLI